MCYTQTAHIRHHSSEFTLRDHLEKTYWYQIMLPSLFTLFLTSFLYRGLGATKISGINDEPTGTWNLTTTDTLRRTLLPGYDRWVRPASNNEATPVKFSLTAIHFYIDETKSTATLVGWMKVMWQDHKLRWNASEYAGVGLIRVSSDEVWKPDLELYNVAFKTATVAPQANILLYADGTVLWVPPVKFDVLCRLNLKTWPRDTQTCRFVIGSWTHDSTILNLTFDKTGYENTEQSWEETSGGRWKIKGVHTERLVQYYNCCAEPYTSLQYDITVERRGGAHIMIYEAPIVALIILLIAAAITEPAARGLLLVSVALVSSLYLISVSVQFPNFGDSPPRIAVIYCGLLILAAVWGVTSAVAKRLSHSDKRTVPGALRRFVKKSRPNVGGEDDAVAMSTDADKETVTAADTLSESWSELAILFDRVFLAVGVLGIALVIVLSF